MKKDFDTQLLDFLYNNDIKGLYNLYIWQQYRAGDDLFILPVEHPLYDVLHEKISSYIENQRGYIYIAEHPTNGYYKVGFTRLQPEERIKTLNQAGVFDELVLIKAYEVKDVLIEKLIHYDLANVTPFVHKEFFKTALFIIDNIITQNIYEFNQFLYKTLKV